MVACRARAIGREERVSTRVNEPQKRRSTVELPPYIDRAGRLRTDNLRVIIQLRVGLAKLGGKICAAVSTRLPPQLVGKPEASEAQKGSDARRAQNIRRETAIGRQAEEEPKGRRERAPRARPWKGNGGPSCAALWRGTTRDRSGKPRGFLQRKFSHARVEEP